MYSDVSAFYYGGISEWRLCGIFSQKDLERFASTGLDDAKKIVDRCIECNYSILCIDDELFPKCLYNIECPPALIYINGVMPDIDNISLADTGNFPVKGIRKQAPARIYVNKQNDQQPAKTAVPYVSEKSETVVQKPVHKENLNLPKTAQDVYEYIGNEPVHIDKISADLKIPVFKVLTALTMLEMKDLVSALQGRNYILK